MRFAIVAAITFLATITAASNTFTNPTAGEKVPAGKPLLIKWNADTPGPVNITCRRGEIKNLKNAGPIVVLETNQGNYTWHVPANQQPGDNYALEIQWGTTPGPDDVNYSGLFEITSGNSDKPGNKNSTNTKSPTYTSGSVTESGTPSPTGKKNSTHNTATESSGDSTPSATGSPSSTHSVPGSGAPGAFGASAASVAAVVAVAAAVLFN